MFTRIALLVVTLAPLACQTQTTDDSEPGSPPPEGMVEVIRPNAEGEPLRVHVPQELAPAVEVDEGARCGILDAQGTLLSCRPGTSCVSPAEGVPGTCQAAPRGPRWDG